MHIEVKDIKLINKGSVVSSCNVRIPEICLIIRDVLMFEKNGSRWFNLPSRTYEADGKKKYYSFIIFDDSDKTQSFQDDLRKAYDLAVGTSSVQGASLEENLPF